MQSKRILSLFLLSALLLLSACARQNPDPSPSSSQTADEVTVRLSGDPVDRAEILPEGKTYRLIAADEEAFYPYDRTHRAPETRPFCRPHFHPDREPTFSEITVSAQEQKSIYEQALARLGGQAGLPELLYSFGDETRIGQLEVKIGRAHV